MWLQILVNIAAIIIGTLIGMSPLLWYIRKMKKEN